MVAKISIGNLFTAKYKVTDTLDQAFGKDDFVVKLKESNIDVVFRYTDKGRIYSVTFVDHDTMTALNDSRLSKELDLFQQGQSFNPDEEGFRHRMQRKKKKGMRRRF